MLPQNIILNREFHCVKYARIQVFSDWYCPFKDTIYSYAGDMGQTNSVFNIFYACFSMNLQLLGLKSVCSSYYSHWAKNVQILSFFWSVSSCIRTRKNSVFGHFSRSECLMLRFNKNPYLRLIFLIFDPYVSNALDYFCYN